MQAGNTGLKKRIEGLCAERGMSLSAAERMCGFGKNTFTRWANNSPTGDKLVTAAKVFGVSVEYLVTGKDPDTKMYSDKIISLLPKMNGLSDEQLDGVGRFMEQNRAEQEAVTLYSSLPAREQALVIMLIESLAKKI